MFKGRILSGMRPTGKLHIGHHSVLENWVKLQEEYECFFTIVDWHALTTSYDNTEKIKENIREMLLSWLSIGIDPQKSTIFIQSHIKEHAELHLLLSMITPLSWLERVPTYKEQLYQLQEAGKDVSTYGFLGYPLLQAADIIIYCADTVPVGEDQLPHLEFCREIVRRFHYIYNTRIFPEPKAMLSRIALLPGIDGRKMSKSYGNDIAIDSDSEALWEKVRSMVTDPARIHRTDPGHPEVCTVFAYQKIFNTERIDEIKEICEKGKIGCVACKKDLAGRMDKVLEPIRSRRKELEANENYLNDVLKEGEIRARKVVRETMEKVREAMGIG